MTTNTAQKSKSTPKKPASAQTPAQPAPPKSLISLIRDAWQVLVSQPITALAGRIASARRITLAAIGTVRTTLREQADQSRRRLQAWLKQNGKVLILTAIILATVLVTAGVVLYYYRTSPAFRQMVNGWIGQLTGRDDSLTVPDKTVTLKPAPAAKTVEEKEEAVSVNGQGK